MTILYLLVLLSTRVQFIYTESSVEERPACMNSYLSALPDDSKVYILEYDDSADAVNVTFFCDSLNSYTHGGLLLNNECENGTWSRMYDRFECKYNRTCPSKEFHEMNGRCHFLGPATTYTRSLEDCSNMDTSLAILTPKDFESSWYTAFLDGVKDDFIWIGLEKDTQSKSWIWHDKSVFNLASSAWKEGYPRDEANYVHAMIEVKSKKLVNVKDDFTDGNTLGNDLRGYKWCITDALEVPSLGSNIPEPFFFKEGTPVSVTIVGIHIDMPLYTEIVFANKHRGEYQKKSQEEWKTFENENIKKQEIIANIPTPMFVGLGGKKGMMCENLSPVSITIENTASTPQKNGVNLDGAQCHNLQDAYSHDSFRLTLAMRAENSMSGRYLVRDRTIGIEEVINVEIVDSEGWTHWAEWGECPTRVSYRRCAKMFHPLTFKAATCNVRYVDKPIKCTSYDHDGDDGDSYDGDTAASSRMLPVVIPILLLPVMISFWTNNLC